MRLIAAVITLGSLLSIHNADAGGRVGEGGGGNGSGGGGRLGQVTGGIGDATGARGGPRQSAPAQDETREGELYARRRHGEEILVVAHDGTIVRRIRPRPEPTGGDARFDVFIGIQKVHESDGAASASLAVEDRWFRLAAAVTRYHEDQMDGARLSLTLPTLMLGVRLDDRRGNSRAYIEGGAAFAVTHNDPLADSSLSGPIIGVHVEHTLGRPSLVGDAHAMFFESGIRAYSARAGVRFGFLEAALRVLDFNVGPALYGPEVGLRF